MELQAVYQYGVGAILVLSPVIFIVLFFFTAPYGRHIQRKRGPSLDPRIGWLLMELPSVVLFFWVYFSGSEAGHMVTLALFSLWELHYLYRTFVYPALIRPGVSMPVSIVAMGGAFNMINAPLNAIALTYLPFSYPEEWLTSLRFLAGTAVFFVGFAVNVHSDHILRNLRNPLEKGYKIPRGGLFRWVTSPNYFGEIVEWCGWALASWSLAGVAFAAFTFSNLAPRGWAHHRWYRANFPDYPKNRKAVIPGLF